MPEVTFSRWLMVFILVFPHRLIAAPTYTLSREIFQQVPFSSMYAEEGALILNVNYAAVSGLILQIESREGVKLENRGETHITVITPPEAKGLSVPNSKGINDFIDQEKIQARYAPTLQQSKFEVICVGKQTKDGSVAYYLVVDSPDLVEVRKEIQQEVERHTKPGNLPLVFDARDNYWPHITIGYVDGDIHGVPKGVATCIGEIEWK